MQNLAKKTLGFGLLGSLLLSLTSLVFPGIIAFASVTNPTQVPIGPSMFPYEAAASPDGQFIYLTEINIGKLIQIRVSDNSVRTVTTTSNAPQGLAVSPNGNRIYVADVNADTIDVFDSQTLTLSSTWQLSPGTGPLGEAISADGNTLFIAGYYNNKLVKVDTSTGIASYFPSGNGPSGVAVSSDGSKVYTSNYYSNTVAVHSVASGTQLASIAVGTQPSGMAISPNGAMLFVANEGSNSVSFVDTSTLTVIYTVSPFSQPRFISVSPDGSTLAVSTVNDNGVTLASVSTHQVTHVLPVPGPGFAQGVAFTTRGESLWAAASVPGNASKWDVNPPLYLPGPTPTPTPTATTEPTLSATGLDASPYLLISGSLVGVGVIALAIVFVLRRRTPSRTE